MGVVNFELLDCILRTTTKKWTPTENPSYAYAETLFDLQILSKQLNGFVSNVNCSTEDDGELFPSDKVHSVTST